MAEELTKREAERAASETGWLSSRWPVVLIGIATLAASLSIGANIREREALTLRTITLREHAAAVTEIEHHTHDSVKAIERLAASWVRRAGLLRPDFEAEASILVRDLPFFRGIGWVDPSFHVRWIVPLAGNELAVDFDLGQEPRRRLALEASREDGVTTMSPPVELVQGGLGFLVYVPVEVGGRFDGFIGGVLRAGDLFSGVFENVAPGFAVRIKDAGELVYARYDSSTELPWTPSAHTSGLPRSWSIEVAPRPEVVSAVQTQLPLTVVVSGGGLALAFAITANLARLRRLRNRDLSGEIRLRRSAEEELKRVLGEIPDHIWSGELTQSGYRTTFYSPAISKITGRPAETYESSLDAWHEIVHEDDRENLQRAQRELLTGQRPGFELEYRIRRADGTLRWVSDRVHATVTDQGVRLDGVTSDITEAKRIQAEQLHHEREMLLVQERERMMREMHDGLGGQLVSTISMLELGNSSSKEVTESLRRALDEMRIVLDSLDPRTSELTTSLGKLRSRVASLMERNGIQLRWQVEDIPGLDDFPPEHALHLLRIIQEGVTNCVRYAKAHEVRVSIRAVGVSHDRLSLEISDDGCGFDLSSVHGGRGIRNIKSRAVALEGELRIESGDSGTRIRLDIPLPPQQSTSTQHTV